MCREYNNCVLNLELQPYNQEKTDHEQLQDLLHNLNDVTAKLQALGVDNDDVLTLSKSSQQAEIYLRPKGFLKWLFEQARYPDFIRHAQKNLQTVNDCYASLNSREEGIEKARELSESFTNEMQILFHGENTNNRYIPPELRPESISQYPAGILLTNQLDYWKTYYANRRKGSDSVWSPGHEQLIAPGREVLYPPGRKPR